MRPVRASILARAHSVCLVLAVLTPWPAPAATVVPARVLTMASVSAVSLTGDPLIQATDAESLFKRVMSLPVFRYVEPPKGSQGLVEGGCYVIPNPFWMEPLDSASLSVALELEVSYYGPSSNVKGELAAYWFWGILGTVFTSGDAVAGVVQWRATLRGPGFPDTLVSVGRGACADKPERLGRREAIRVANKRALYDLSRRMAEAVNKACRLRLKRKFVDGDAQAFRAEEDSW